MIKTIFVAGEIDNSIVEKRGKPSCNDIS